MLEALRAIVDSIDKARDAITERNMAKIRKDVGEALDEIQKATTNKDRKELILELNRRLSL